jgi:rhamnosyl/mannosyltransferase
VYYKGFEHLISAMAHVDASLFIIGTGPLKANLTSLASNLRVSEKVTFLEHVENVHPYHHAADLFVLPSVARSEAFGIVQLEAMAAGKPVINTKLESGVPFVSQHGLTGLTVPPRDSWALAEAMNCLLNNEDLRRQYGASARRRAMGEFSLEMMIGRTMTVYRTILASPQTPTGACFQENSFAAAN